MHSEPPPASPPDARFIMKDLNNCFFLSTLGNSLLIESLKAKLKAWVGKYLKMLVKFPLQKASIPCSEYMRIKQFPMPVYRGISPLFMRGLAS